MAVENATKFIMSKNWTIQSVVKESGIISATTVVGKGRTLTLNVSMTSKKDGLDIFIITGVPGGIGVNGNEIKDEFCEIVSAAEPPIK
ncbi:MAG: hypothetical protein EHM45_00795 [Desulfobacteraceae bacterium]|nr:MAG: hypothetical protein EHM45_00795 [Desulfobacteraceae bacterium]